MGDKGVNELIHAFVKILNNKKQIENPAPVKLELVGWDENHLDPVSPETRQLIETTPEICLEGPKSGDALLAYYAAADCFVFPSYREGFPNTVLEAGAMELASIVTDINGSREIVSSGENGIVIPSKDADALYEAMVWMLEHEEERRKMGKRAQEIVAERYEQSFVRSKLYEFYSKVLSEKH